MIFEVLDQLKANVIEQLSGFKTADEHHSFPWDNLIWTSDTFRRAHFDVVDLRDTRKLYMMHLTVFPHTCDGAPIFGFDLIAGKNKVTGAFHDFSPVDPAHNMLGWFSNRVKDLSWSKPRVLPDWARQIFSESMVAAGNVTDETELKTITSLVADTLAYYLNNVGGNYGRFGHMQNKYCANQKLNPQTPKVMRALGFEGELVDEFIKKCLFPEISSSENTP
jgi:phycocyanobilin:ferredoxin oxidoreductase